MKTVKIPVGLTDSQTRIYVQNQLRSQRMKAGREPEKPLQIPDDSNAIEIPGDDWTTRRKGMSGRTLKKVIRMKAELRK